MNDTLDGSTRRLTKARQSGDADDVAEALVLHANELLRYGQFAVAHSALEEAAEIHRSRGRVYDEARCTQLAATLYRFEGRLEEAKQRARSALALIGATGPIAVSAYTELGEIALAERQGATAVSAYTSALKCGEVTGLIGPARAALLRRRAAAQVSTGQIEDAVHDLEIAFSLLTEAGDQTSATRTLIEEATAFQYGGQTDAAERSINRAMELAKQENDHSALADIYLLHTTQAIENRDATVAMASALAARKQALAANAPTSYIGATIAIADLADRNGDRATAYETLATGWVTLADLLGGDVARATFEPKLRELRERWGNTAFTEIKMNYEARRTKRSEHSSSTT